MASSDKNERTYISERAAVMVKQVPEAMICHVTVNHSQIM